MKNMLNKSIDNVYIIKFALTKGLNTNYGLKKSLNKSIFFRTIIKIYN